MTLSLPGPWQPERCIPCPDPQLQMVLKNVNGHSKMLGIAPDFMEPNRWKGTWMEIPHPKRVDPHPVIQLMNILKSFPPASLVGVSTQEMWSSTELTSGWSQVCSRQGEHWTQ